jgi:hypothetical protein
MSDPAVWWGSGWDDLCRLAPVTSHGRLGRTGPSVPEAQLDGCGHVDDVLSLWPRLTHDQRARVRERLLARKTERPARSSVTGSPLPSAARRAGSTADRSSTQP